MTIFPLHAPLWKHHAQRDISIFPLHRGCVKPHHVRGFVMYKRPGRHERVYGRHKRDGSNGKQDGDAIRHFETSFRRRRREAAGRIFHTNKRSFFFCCFFFYTNPQIEAKDAIEGSERSWIYQVWEDRTHQVSIFDSVFLTSEVERQLTSGQGVLFSISSVLRLIWFAPAYKQCCWLLRS